MGLLVAHAAPGSLVWLFAVTGILGAYTTVSSFALNTVQMWQSGAYLWAGINMAGSIVLSVGAVALGFLVGRGMSLWVALGAALGAGARAGLWWVLPLYGTLCANFIGSVLIGLLAPMPLSGRARAFGMTGFCGGFTTFFAFWV